ncbi:GrdX family protein [Desulfovibrio sp. OttesenSCG-928-A18]|nr:GrdX family protein [Desulfovibrio sp. OttesenSCG-928-A18]
MREFAPWASWLRVFPDGLRAHFSPAPAHEARRRHFKFFLVSGPVPPMLLAVRDCVHLGWKLLHHPLYGNFRPHQQPYRSILLEGPPVCAKAGQGAGGLAPDAMSLHLVEEALLVYESGPCLDPDMAPAPLRDACAVLDCELMRLPLLQSGMSEDGLGAFA